LDTFNDIGTTTHTKRRLNFRFRPEDIHSHPACGDPSPGEHALILIQKLRRKSNPKEIKYQMKIVGSSSLSYKFLSPADVQQLPAIEERAVLEPGSFAGGIGGIEEVEPNITSLLEFFDPIKNNLMEILKNDNREDETAPDELSNFFLRDDIPLFIPPQIFLQSDKPTNHLFRDPIVNKAVRNMQHQKKTTSLVF
jgi:hypothetical protein